MNSTNENIDKFIDEIHVLLIYFIYTVIYTLLIITVLYYIYNKFKIKYNTLIFNPFIIPYWWVERLTVDQTCPITGEPITADNVIFTRCGHLFDKTALNRWLQINNTCPLCYAPYMHIPHSKSASLTSIGHGL